MCTNQIDSPKFGKIHSGRGFSLIELMIVVAIIGILAAIAMPAYNNHVISARLTDAFSALSSAQSSAELYWSNQIPRTYVGFDASNSFPGNPPKPNPDFTYTLAATASNFTITATGQGTVAGFVFTINDQGVKTSNITKAGWAATSATCWINGKGGACASQ